VRGLKKKEYNKHAHWSMLVTAATTMLTGYHGRSTSRSSTNNSYITKSTHPQITNQLIHKSIRTSTHPQITNQLIHKLIHTKSVPNYSSFDFFSSSLTTRLIQKFVQNISSFVVACFINKVLQECHKFDYVCTNILNKTSHQTWGKKTKQIIIWNGGSTT
jgi:hypothetical protein